MRGQVLWAPIWFIQTEFLLAVCYLTGYPLFHMALLKYGAYHPHKTLSCTHPRLYTLHLRKKINFLATQFFVIMKFHTNIHSLCLLTEPHRRANRNQLFTKLR